MNHLRELLSDPLILQGLAVFGIFVLLLLLFRRVQKIAEEMEKRKALSEYVRGLDEFLRGEHRAALGTLEAVIERDPDNVEARIALGDCYRELGDPAEAKKHHHHVHKVFGHELARNFLSLARDELALRNYDRAVEAFERTLSMTPRDADALAGLAQAYAEGGNPVMAAETLRQLYPEGPGKDLGRLARREAARRFADAGAALLEEGEADRAVKLFTEALAFQPENFRARAGLLAAVRLLGDAEKARRLMEEHLAALRSLSADERILFEPAGARRRDAAAAATAVAAGEAPPERAGSSASTALSRVEGAGALVAAVEAKTARYGCAACGSLSREFAETCPDCKGVGTVEALPELAALYTLPLPDFRGAMDEVEENAAFLHALARKASLGDAEAERKLLERGPRVLYEVFAALPAIEARRALGEKLAALGPEAAREVTACHAARGRGLFGDGAEPHDEFTAAFLLALGDVGEPFLGQLGDRRDAAVAGALADPRLSEAVRERAARDLAARPQTALAPLVDAVAASGDPSAVDRAAAILRGFGPDAVDALEKRYLEATLLGRLFGPRGVRRRTVADLLARTGLPRAREALERAAAAEKDAGLRAHYGAAIARLRKEGGA